MRFEYFAVDAKFNVVVEVVVAFIFKVSVDASVEVVVDEIVVLLLIFLLNILDVVFDDSADGVVIVFDKVVRRTDEGEESPVEAD